MTLLLDELDKVSKDAYEVQQSAVEALRTAENTLDGIEGVNRNVPALCPVACDNPDVGGWLCT